MNIPIDVVPMLQERCGKHIISYLAHYVKDDKFRRFIDARARAFEVRGQSTPVNLHGEYMLDIGGQWHNNLNTVAAADMAKADTLLELLSEAVGFKATAENTMAAFICRRFVDIAASTRHNRFLLSFSEGLIVVCVDKDSKRAVVCTVDREGAIARHSLLIQSYMSPIL